VRAVRVGCIVLFALRCAGNPDQIGSPADIDVVWVAGDLPFDSAAFEGLGSGGVSGASVTLYGVATADEGRRLLMTLRARGDSIVLGLGRAMLPVLRDARGYTRLWVGYDTTATTVDARWAAWWAPAESLRLEVARLAIRDAPSQIVLVGSSVGSDLLRILQDSHARILPAAVGPGTPSRGVLAAPDDVVLMVDMAPLPDGVWDRVYWACESPFQAAPEARVELHMDWRGAITAAIQWHLGRGGIPPGPTLGPWLTLRTREVS